MSKKGIVIAVILLFVFTMATGYLAMKWFIANYNYASNSSFYERDYTYSRG